MYTLDFRSIVHLRSQWKRIFGDIVLLLAQSKSNSPRSLKGFRRTLRRNFIWIPQQVTNLPIYSSRKKAPFFGNFIGKLFIFCQIQLMNSHKLFSLFSNSVHCFDIVCIIGNKILFKPSTVEIWPHSSSETFQWSRWIWAWLSKK